MANQEHLDLLKQGVHVWNRWREEYPDIEPDLTEADLNGLNFMMANLSRANLSRSNLIGTNLIGANLTLANLSRATLTWANLSIAFLSDANLGGANLSGVNFNRALLTGANISQAKVTMTQFGDVDLSMVKGLESVSHIGSSSIGIDTFYRSGGHIPEVFLRGAGVPDAFITFAYSLINKPIEYYSCFISYSSRDQDFAERLYTDLQAVGVRCWFAPADLKIGDNLRERIDEAIQLHDKLLLVLSKHSVISRWVEKEVEVALAKESEQQRTILFPIRLDDSIIASTSDWATQLRDSKNIGDFRRWKNREEYQRAFARLIANLAMSVAKEPDKQEQAK